MTEPVSLELARKQCRIEDYDTEADDLLLSYIVNARDHVESETGLTLVQKTVVEHLPAFVPPLGTLFLDEPHRCPDPCAIAYRSGRPLWLTAWPIVSVDQIAYTDPDGVAQTLAGTRLVAGAWPALLWPPRDEIWPSISEAEGVDVTMTIGFDGADVPERAIQAMLLLIGHFYQNREGVRAGERSAAVELPQGIDTLLEKLKLKRV